MVRKLAFTSDGWDDYNYWLDNDRSKAKKIKALLEDIDRNGAAKGEGHPELLKYDPGFYSRHITKSDRLIYTVSKEEIIIKKCRGHYDDKQGPDHWAGIMIAETWDELQDEAREHKELREVAEAMLKVSEDKRRKWLAEAHDDYLSRITTFRNMGYREAKAEDAAELKAKDETIAEQSQAIAEKDETIAEQSQAIAEKDRIIARLEEQLAASVSEHAV